MMFVATWGSGDSNQTLKLAILAGASRNPLPRGNAAAMPEN